MFEYTIFHAGPYVVIIGFVLGIVFAVKAISEKDKDVRKFYIKKSLLSFFGPIVAIFILLSINGIIGVLSAIK